MSHSKYPNLFNQLTIAAGLPEFRLFPYENANLEPFETAVVALNPVVAVKVRSAAVHAALAEVYVLFFPARDKHASAHRLALHGWTPHFFSLFCSLQLPPPIVDYTAGQFKKKIAILPLIFYVTALTRGGLSPHVLNFSDTFSTLTARIVVVHAIPLCVELTALVHFSWGRFSFDNLHFKSLPHFYLSSLLSFPC